LAANVSELLAIEGTTLKVEAFKLDSCSLVKLVSFKGGDKLQLIDSNLELSSRALSESVQEGFWMNQVTEEHWALQESALLDSANPVAKGNALLVDRADPSTWVHGTIPKFLPSLGELALQKLSSDCLGTRGQHGGSL